MYILRLCLRLPLQIRSVVSDFCVFIAIVIVTGCDALVGIGTPKLITPAKFAVSSMSYSLFVILHIYISPWSKTNLQKGGTY